MKRASLLLLLPPAALLLGTLQPAVVRGADVDPATMVVQARRAFEAPGTFKTIVTYDKGRYTQTETCFRKVTPDGRILVRQETIIRYPTVYNRSVMLTTPEGMWNIRSGVGIKVPAGMFEDVISKAAASVDPHQPRKPSMWTTRDGQFGGKPVFLITRMFSADVQKLVGDQTTSIALSAANALDPAADVASRKKLAAKAGQSVPERTEYAIDKESGLIVFERSYSRTGELIRERRFDSVERGLDLPDDLFRVPSGCTLYFPKSLFEYIGLLKKHAEMHKTKTKKPVDKAKG